MRKIVLCAALFPIVAVLVLASCKTEHRVDIYPHAPKEPIRVEVKVDLHIYKHAVQDVGYITGAEAPAPAPETPAEEKPKEETTPAPEKKESRAGDFLLRLLGVGVAYAETPSDQQQLKRVLDSMRSRYPTLRKYKTDKTVGENHNGFVEERPSPKMSDEKYAKPVRQVIAGENADRRLLYQIRARMDRTSVDKQAAVYAKTWREIAKPGEWIEVLVKNPDGKEEWVWKQK